MGTDKAVMELDGEPLFRLVARRLGEVADPVLLASGTAGRLGASDHEEISDKEHNKGPLAGIVAGLEASPHRAVAVVAVDMPSIDPRLLANLAEMLSAELDAVVPETEDGPQPLHAVYSRDALGGLTASLTQGPLRLTDVLGTLDVLWVGREELAALGATPEFSSNLNHPGDI